MQHNFSPLLLLFVCILFPFAGKSQAYRYETAVPLELLSGASPQVVSMPWAGGLNAAQAALADTDGDGSPELVIYDRSSTQVQVFAQTAEGWRWLPYERLRFPADLTNWLQLVDFNGDGRKDLFTYTPAGIRVFENKAAGGQPAQWELSHPLLTYPGRSGEVNLLVNSADVPLIADTDGDGDIDIASFDPSGSGTIRWYKNVGVEKWGRTDVLAFELADMQWGGITECSCQEPALNYAACADAGGRLGQQAAGQRPLHAGGKSLLWHDLNGDAVPDLVIGEEECTKLYTLLNSGTAANPVFASSATGLPGLSAEAPDFAYPAAYALGNQVLVSTNLRNAGTAVNLQASLWLYTPNGNGSFNLSQKNFLQHQMLDVGEETRPLFFDVDGDGDADLLLGSKGSLQPDGYYASLQLYENTGSRQAPAFRLKDQDYLGFAAAKYQYLQPQTADFNQDGIPDLVLTALDKSVQKVRTLVYLNKAARGAAANFSGSEPLVLPLLLSTLDYPFYFDVNADGLQDVLVGRFDGSLRFFENTGTAAAPAFSLQDNAYKGFALENVRRHLIPFVGDANADGRPDLLVSDASGGLRVLYSFQEQGLLAADAAEVTLKAQEKVPAADPGSLRLGDRSWPVLAPLWGAEQPALAVGQIGGGLVLLRSGEALPLPDSDAFVLDVYPNPNQGMPVHIKTNAPAQLRIYSLLGQQLAGWQTAGYETHTWEPLLLPPGMYLVEARFAGLRKVKVLILAP